MLIDLEWIVNVVRIDQIVQTFDEALLNVVGTIVEAELFAVQFHGVVVASAYYAATDKPGRVDGVDHPLDVFSSAACDHVQRAK